MNEILGYLGLENHAGLSRSVPPSEPPSPTATPPEGALKVNPEKSGNYMVLSALPAAQGIYGFVAFFMWLGKDFAAQGASVCSVSESL